MSSLWVLVTNILYVALELNKGGHELVLSATGGEVDDGVDRGKSSGEVEKN